MRFLTRTRLSRYSRVLVAFYCVFWIGWFIAGAGLLGLREGPAGNDFLVIYAGTQLVTGGEPAAAYEFSHLLAAAKEIIGQPVKVGPWLYPPVFPTVVMPFTYLPYLLAAPIWLFLTGAGYLYAVGRTYPDPLAPWLAAASLAAFDNAMGGQNGFLSALLLGFGLLHLRASPVLGGAVLGCLVYKPQLAALVPVVLLLGGQWRALLGFVAGALAAVGLSMVVVGWDGWVAFVNSIPGTRTMLEAGGPNLFKMPTVFVAARLLGAGAPVAQIAQAVVATGTLATVVWVWVRPTSFALKAAALGFGSLLMFPFAHYYDWSILAIPVAWLVRDMSARGVVTSQAWCIVALFFWPLFGPTIAALTKLQLGPLVLLAMLAIVVDRARKDHAEGRDAPDPR